MIKFLYSKYTKFAAVFLIITLAFAATFLAVRAVWDFESDGTVYNLENNFENCFKVKELLYLPYFEVMDIVSEDNVDFKDLPKYKEDMDERFKKLSEKEGLLFYVKINEYTYSDTPIASKEYFGGMKYRLLGERDFNDGREYFEFSNPAWGMGFAINCPDIDNISVYAALDDDYAENLKAEWLAGKNKFLNICYALTAMLLLAFALLVYLVVVCGKASDGEKITNRFDCVWSEISLFFVVISALTPLYDIIIVKEIFYDFDIGLIAVLLFNVVMVFFFLLFFLSAVRNIKNRVFLKRFLVYKIAVCFKNTCKKIALGLKMSDGGAAFSVMFFIYTAAVGLFGVMLPSFPPAFLFAVGLFAFVLWVGVMRFRDLEKIKSGVDTIKNGNPLYKITDIKCSDYLSLAESINEIGNGIEKSAEDKLKAERMKTELITNVSHDLKTPLTSIINYINLLLKVENMPSEALDYLKIAEQKSIRLKNLTSDLFDISKVQSGNESLDLKLLNAEVLIQQSMAENESEIDESGIVFCVNVEKGLAFTADGKKMSRVTDNLINNIVKYSQKGTRAFINGYSRGNVAVLEFKNISSYPLDFDREEITERFVRGDRSRTEEGNGLGLAIAKSYTEACGGNFEIVTDGDLFKAVLKFEK